MADTDTSIKKDPKQRVTAFVDPVLVKRAKVHGALEGLTISEIVERALDAYAPKIETDADQHIKLKFTRHQEISTPSSEFSLAFQKIRTKEKAV